MRGTLQWSGVPAPPANCVWCGVHCGGDISVVVGPVTTAGLGSHTDWHQIFISQCAQKPVETAHHAPLVVVWLVSLVSGGALLV